MGGRLAEAYHQANANGWDILQSDYLLFRILRNLRRRMYREAIQQQERTQARAVAEGRLTPEAAAEPTLLERADAIAETVEGAGETVFQVKREILEGAVLGDFKENPTIWNTIGQIAMGFVPYAGQVADIRDLIASIGKLRKSGWKDPWEWFNLVLVVIGFIPGVGDAIKAAGRGGQRSNWRGVRWVMRHAGRLWGAITRRVPGMLRSAARFGRWLLQGAAGLGRRLLQGARDLGRRAANAARGAVQRVRQLIGRVGDTARRLASGITERARSAVSRARGLVGRVVGAIGGAVRRALNAATDLIGRGAARVRQLMDAGRQAIRNLMRRAGDALRRAASFVAENVRRALEAGRRAYQTAREAAGRAIREMIRRGRQLVSQGYNRARTIIRSGLKWVKERAVRWVKDRLRALKHRILNF